MSREGNGPATRLDLRKAFRIVLLCPVLYSIMIGTMTDPMPILPFSFNPLTAPAPAPTPAFPPFQSVLSPLDVHSFAHFQYRAPLSPLQPIMEGEFNDVSFDCPLPQSPPMHAGTSSSSGTSDQTGSDDLNLGVTPSQVNLVNGNCKG